ncbi:MAG: cell division protein ZapD [Methylococcaceae bacterium]
MKDYITYEFPLNERIRLFMRVEQLFQQIHHFSQGDSLWDSRALVTHLLEMLNLLGRNDLKSEVLKELDRHTTSLTRMARKEGSDAQRIGEILNTLEVMSRTIYAIPGRIGGELMDDDLIKSIAQRTSIPGGTCSFDLPAFHRWLHLDREQRVSDLNRWLQSLQIIQTAISRVLGFIRSCSDVSTQMALSGYYQKTLDHNLPYQLLSVSLEIGDPCYAEISGGKHRFSVRFMVMDKTGRPIQATSDIAFQLNCAIL